MEDSAEYAVHSTAIRDISRGYPIELSGSRRCVRPLPWVGDAPSPGYGCFYHRVPWLRLSIRPPLDPCETRADQSRSVTGTIAIITTITIESPRRETSRSTASAPRACGRPGYTPVPRGRTSRRRRIPRPEPRRGRSRLPPRACRVSPTGDRTPRAGRSAATHVTVVGSPTRAAQLYYWQRFHAESRSLSPGRPA